MRTVILWLQGYLSPAIEWRGLMLERSLPHNMAATDTVELNDVTALYV